MINVPVYQNASENIGCKNTCTLAEFLCQFKDNGQGQRLFFSFVCGVTLPSTANHHHITSQPPSCPFHPSVHYGTSAEVGCMGLTLAGSLVAGGSWTDSMSSQRKRDRVHSKCARKKVPLTTSWCLFIQKKPNLGWGGVSKHFT